MRVGVFGSYDWDNYNEVIRQLTLFIQEAAQLEHENIVFVHSGKRGAENMITEYIGKTEKFLRQKNFRLKEELMTKNGKLNDHSIIDSGIEYALIFSTKDKRTYGCKNMLDAYNIPYLNIEA
jgi:hypothetical protein